MSRAWFVSSRQLSGIAYEVTYEYDPGALTVRWHIVDRTLRDLDGEATFTPLAPDRCKLTYGLRASSLEVSPGGFHFRDEQPAPVTASFRTWVESSGQ